MMLSMLTIPDAPPTDSGNSDRQLTQAAARGEQTARHELAARLYERVRATTSYLVGGDADRDDFIQLSLMEILRSAGNFRGEGSLEAWADRITVRKVLRLLKRRRKRGETPMDPTDIAARVGAGEQNASATPRSAQASPSQEAERRELHRHLAALLTRIDPDRRAAVVLHWAHGYRVKEIAELTGTRVSTVRWRLLKGKRELQVLIADDPVLHNWKGLLPS